MIFRTRKKLSIKFYGLQVFDELEVTHFYSYLGKIFALLKKWPVQTQFDASAVEAKGFKHKLCRQLGISYRYLCHDNSSIL